MARIEVSRTGEAESMVKVQIRTRRETVQELADRLDRCDHLVVMNSAPDTDDEMLQTGISADEHALIVVALRRLLETEQ